MTFKQISAIMLVSATVAVSADTVVYYQMQDDAPGRESTQFSSMINAPELNAVVGKASHLPVLKFTDDVPGKIIVADGKIVNADNRAALSIQARDNKPTLTIPLNDKLKLDDFTVEFFIKISNSPNWAELFGLPRPDGCFTYLIQLQADKGMIQARIDSNPPGAANKTGFNQGVSSTVNIRDGKWHHAAFTYDGLSRKASLYIDYQLAKYVITPLPLVYNGNQISLFKATSGQIDELRISNFALTPEQFLKIQQ